MTHYCYVRTHNRGALTPLVSGIYNFGVMPARFTLLVTLCVIALSVQGQSFLHVTCDAECTPALTSTPADSTFACDDAWPEIGEITGEGCTDAPIENLIGLDMDASVVTRYDVTTALGDGVDWALWLGDFDAMGLGASEHFVPTSAGLTLELYNNGTARFQGEVENDNISSQRFELDVFLQYAQDHDSWTAAGRLPKDDLGQGAYVDWTYFELVDTLSRLIGRGDFEGDMLYLDHMPTSRIFGYQMGEGGANNRNTNLGISGWFWFRGKMSGQTVVGTGDINADLENEEVIPVECPVVEEHQRIRMAWSDCGHDLHENTLTRIDEEAPMFLSIPELIAVDCTQLPDTPSIEAFELEDACGSVLTLEVSSDVVEGPPCNQTLTRTWTLTDACGNSTDTAQFIALIDTTGPTFELMDTTLVCDEWDNYVAFEIEPEDNCSPADSVIWTYMDTIVSGIYPFQFTLDRIYSATDLCGNTTVDTMTIEVIDTVAPTWVFLPPDTTILCDEWENYTIIQPIVQDNCDPSPDGPGGGGATDTTITEGDCFGEFLVELTFEFADMSGNTITYVQVISAVDTIPPTFPYFPPDTVLDCSMEYPSPGDDPIWMATAEDNFCPFAVTFEDSLVAGACLGSDTLFRTFTAIDDCENTTVQTQVLVRQDTLAPLLLQLPEDTAIACGAELPAIEIVAVDNCSGVDSTWVTVDTLDIAFGDAVSTGFEACTLDGFVSTGGTISITSDAFDGSCAVEMLHFAGDDPHNFYAEDILAGRGTYSIMAKANDFISDNRIQLLAGDAVDSEALTISLRPNGTDNPGISIMGFGVDVATSPIMGVNEWYEAVAVLGEDMLTLSINGEGVLEVALPEGLPQQGRFKVGASYSGSYDDMAYLPESPCPVVERFGRTLHALDGCGNLATAVQIIDVIDTVGPVFSVEDTSLICDNWAAFEPIAPELMDGCSDEGLTWGFEDELVSGVMPASFVLNRIYSASDACGNVTLDTMVITVIDTTPPTLTQLPNDTIILCDQWDTLSFPVLPPMCMDNCDTTECEGGDPVFDTIPGDCAGEFLILITFQFNDGSGNTVTYTQTVTAVDTIAPEFTYVPVDTALNCTEPWPDPAADAFWEAEYIDNFCPDTLFYTDSLVAGPCMGTDTLFRTWTALDECGNATDSLQTIVRIDTIGPVIDTASIPGPVTIQCMDDLPVDVPTATDACSDEVMLVVSADTTGGEGICAGGIEVTRTFTFTDDCGNSSFATQLITVVDTLAPEFGELPSAAIFYCEETLPTCADFDVQAFDTCCETEVSCEEQTDATDCPGTFTLRLVYTATDENGNVATAEVAYDVVDTLAPLIGSVPADTVINCAVATSTPTLDSTFFDVTDGCNPWTFNVTTAFEGQEDDPCNYTRIDTYQFVDCNSNLSEFIHILTVQDTTGPNVVSTPTDLFLDCPQEVPEFDTSLPLSEWMDDVLDLDVSDDCNGDLSEMTATYEDVLTLSVDETHYTLTRKWTFFDHCLNPTEHDQIIDVSEPDLELPNAFSPPGSGTGNGYNDTYVIGNLGLTDDESGYYPPCYWDGDASTNYFRVYNRWGTLVFETEGGELYKNNWDGKSSITGEPLPDGTYFVLLILGNGRQWGSYVDLRNDQ